MIMEADEYQRNEEGDDVVRDQKVGVVRDPYQVPVGRGTRARAKKFTCLMGSFMKFEFKNCPRGPLNKTRRCQSVFCPSDSKNSSN